MEVKWLNPKRLYEEFGISINTQVKWRKGKKIPYSKIGGFIFYDRETINKWLTNHTVVGV